MFVEGDFTLRDNGAYVRIAEQIDFLLGIFSRVFVYGYLEHSTNPWTEAGRQRFSAQYPTARLILEAHTFSLRLFAKFKNLAILVIPSLTRKILAWQIKTFAPKYVDLCSQFSDSILISNYVESLTLLNGCQFYTIIETHDLKFLVRAKQGKRPIFALRILEKFRREFAILYCVEAIISISSAESALFKLLLPSVKRFYIPVYIGRSAPPQRMTVSDSEERKFDLIFVGSMNSFNAEGLCKFLEENSEWVSERRIAVVGNVCDHPMVIAFRNRLPKLNLLGFVDDMSEIYMCSKAALSPVEGAGVKIKVLDALYNGKPVFASDHSRDGLPRGWEDCVFPLTRTAIESLLDDPIALSFAEKNAQRYCSTILTSGDTKKFAEYLRRIRT